MQGEGRTCSTSSPPTCAPPGQVAQLLVASQLPRFQGIMKSKQSSEEHFLPGTGHAAPSWDAPADIAQDSSAIPVSPPDCLFPFPSLPSRLLMAEGELGSVLAVAAAALSLLSPPAPQQYLSSLMPAVAPR